MQGKVMVIVLFVLAGTGAGMIKDWKGIEGLWVIQAGFLLTANLMMLEYAWRSPNRRKRLFMYPILGVIFLTALIATSIDS